MDDFLDKLASLVATKLAAELRAANDDGWVPQKGSPIGPRKHIDAVRRRVEQGDSEAEIRPGRKFMLTRRALDEERRGMGVARPPVKALTSVTDLDEDTGVKLRLLRKLGRA